MTDVTEAVRLLDILQTQMLSLAASAQATADIAAMLKDALSGGAQGANSEEQDQLDESSLLVEEDSTPSTFGNVRGKRRKPPVQE